MLSGFKIAFGEADDVVEFHGIGAIAVACKRNDDSLLCGGVHDTSVL